jgi:hypothetical protein
MVDHVEELKRQERLERLYVEDGRDNPEHPFHALYTGLHQQTLNDDDRSGS